MQNKFHIHIYSSVYVIEFCLKLTVRSQRTVKIDRNAWKTFEMSCLSKTWSDGMLIHTGRVV